MWNSPILPGGIWEPLAKSVLGAVEVAAKATSGVVEGCAATFNGITDVAKSMTPSFGSSAPSEQEIEGQKCGRSAQVEQYVASSKPYECNFNDISVPSTPTIQVAGLYTGRA